MWSVPLPHKQSKGSGQGSNYSQFRGTIQIEDEINCRTRSCLYVLQSIKDPRNRQYAGQTRAEVGTRTKQHAYDIDSDLDKPVPNHFRLTRSTKHDLRVTPVMRVKNNNPWVMLHLERLFINRHNLIEDGINSDSTQCSELLLDCVCRILFLDH